MAPIVFSVEKSDGLFAGFLNQTGVILWGVYNTDFSEAIVYLMSRASGEVPRGFATEIFKRGSISVNTNSMGTVAATNPTAGATYRAFYIRLSKQ